MKQLSGLEAFFLEVEDERVVGHVGSLIVLDPSTSGGRIDADVIRDFIAERIHLLPTFHWRLAPVPFGIDLPYWVTDPGLDLDFHVRGIALPAPGDDQQLARQVERIVARPMDRAHPLWEVYVIEGLAGGRVGILSKLHHSAVDGLAGVHILTTLLSTEPHAPPPDPAPVTAPPRPLPSELEMLLRGWLGVLRKPERAARLALRSAREVVTVGRRFRLSSLGTLRSAVAGPGTPRLPFNRTLGSQRRWSFGSLDLERVKEVKNRHGVTVNDVVLAVCAGALRQWLLEHDALPDEPVRVMVPVSMRVSDQSDAAGNYVSAVFTHLPTELDDPVERLLEVHRQMAVAKERQDAVPASLLLELTQFAAPAAAEFVARTGASLRWAEHMQLPFNLVVSNVPGPRVPLYYAGGLVEAMYPISIVTDGMGLNITLQSYLDRIDVGLVSTPELMPDLDRVVDHLQAALDELTG